MTAATANTTRTAVSVPDGAAASETFSDVGRMYSHCATPHAQMTVATAPAERTRAPRWAPCTSIHSEITPHRPEMMTSGSAREVKPWKTYVASARNTKIPTNATTPVTTAAITARVRKYSTIASSLRRRASHTRYTAAR